MILLALGSNLEGAWGTAVETLDRAVRELNAVDVNVVKRSTWIASSPFGKTDQPDFVNGVIAVSTHLPPRALLSRCHQVEHKAQRQRRVRWGPRTLDIDVLTYYNVECGRSVVIGQQTKHTYIPLKLPHPGIPNRLFVLEPISEIAPFWHHPVTGKTAFQMIVRLRNEREGAVQANL